MTSPRRRRSRDRLRYLGLRDFSTRVFSRELFLPVAAWLLDQPRGKIHFLDVLRGLKGYIDPPTGPLSKELSRMKNLGMLDPREREGKYRPFTLNPGSPLWESVRSAIRAWEEESPAVPRA